MSQSAIYSVYSFANVVKINSAGTICRSATNLEKSGNLTVVREKSGKVEKVRKMYFACGMLPRLRWSQNKRSLTVLSSVKCR